MMTLSEEVEVNKADNPRVLLLSGVSSAEGFRVGHQCKRETGDMQPLIREARKENSASASSEREAPKPLMTESFAAA